MDNNENNTNVETTETKVETNATPAPVNGETKICKNCNSQIDKKAKVCPKCGKKFGLPTWALVLIIIGAVFLTMILGIVGCTAFVFKKAGEAVENAVVSDFDDWDLDTDDWDLDLDDEKTGDKTAKIGEKFEFDDLEITIGKDYTFTVLDNQFSELNQKPVVKIPITVKNLKSTTHSLNMFYYTVYGPDGTEAREVNSFFDESIDYAGNLLTGAEYTKYIYVVYTGDGKYTIEFSEVFSDKVTLELNVTK